MCVSTRINGVTCLFAYLLVVCICPLPNEVAAGTRLCICIRLFVVLFLGDEFLVCSRYKPLPRSVHRTVSPAPSHAHSLFILLTTSFKGETFLLPSSLMDQYFLSL